MKKIFYTEDNPLVKNLILLDGFARTGKLFLGKIMAGLSDIDYFQSISVLEYLPFLWRLGGLSEDGAIALIRKTIDENAYNRRIGRNLNTRIIDASSIYNSPEFKDYLRKATEVFGDISLTSNKIIEDFWKTSRRSLFILHEVLPNIGVYFKAYPQLKMINLIRNPIDVIYSCLLRGWGKRFGSDPLNFTPSVNSPYGPLPWLAYEWKEEYKRLSETDRVIKSIYSLTQMCKETYRKLEQKQKKRILFVRFEHVVERTNDEIDSICSFLGTKPLESLPVILTREKCPNEISVRKRRQKMDHIHGKASSQGYDLMVELVREYEKRENPYIKE